MDCPDDHSSPNLLIPVSMGELMDRISILELKHRRMTEPTRRANVERELGLLTRVLEQSGRSRRDPALDPLRQINASLWDLENRIRILERDGTRRDTYIEAARDIHRLNDTRHAIKRNISVATGSAVVEEKEYLPAP